MSEHLFVGATVVHRGDPIKDSRACPVGRGEPVKVTSIEPQDQFFAEGCTHPLPHIAEVYRRVTP